MPVPGFCLALADVCRERELEVWAKVVAGPWCYTLG